MQAILVNRKESPGRRNYDLAHELFHILTWDTMPPARLDPERGQAGQAERIEQLANNFAAALLMPSDAVRAIWHERRDLPGIDRIVATADAFKVSAPAMKWRLANLELLLKRELPDDAELAGGGAARSDSEPPLFSADFVRRIHAAVEEGLLSLRKAARIIGTDTAGFADLCRVYGRQLSYDVQGV